MSSFDIAIQLVLKHEGGFTPGLPNDPGGDTNFGISKRVYPDLDIEHLTKEAAIEIYHRDYWKPYMEQEPIQELANAALDTAVNQGPNTAASIYHLTAPNLRAFQLQRLLRYTATGKSQFYHAWFARTLDV